MTQNQTPENLPPFVHDKETNEFAHLFFHHPEHPRVQEFKKKMDELEREHVDLRETMDA